MGESGRAAPYRLQPHAQPSPVLQLLLLSNSLTFSVLCSQYQRFVLPWRTRTSSNGMSGTTKKRKKQPLSRNFLSSTLMISDLCDRGGARTRENGGMSQWGGTRTVCTTAPSVKTPLHTRWQCERGGAHTVCTTAPRVKPPLDVHRAADREAAAAQPRAHERVDRDYARVARDSARELVAAVVAVATAAATAAAAASAQKMQRRRKELAGRPIVGRVVAAAEESRTARLLEKRGVLWRAAAAVVPDLPAERRWRGDARPRNAAHRVERGRRGPERPDVAERDVSRRCDWVPHPKPALAALLPPGKLVSNRQRDKPAVAAATDARDDGREGGRRIAVHGSVTERHAARREPRLPD